MFSIGLDCGKGKKVTKGGKKSGGIVKKMTSIFKGKSKTKKSPLGLYDF